MKTSFNNRVFGCVGVKSINSNYNADFSGRPRTLPNGVAFASDKAFKFANRYYVRANYSPIQNENEGDIKIFYATRYNKQGHPFTISQNYKYLFGEFTKVKLSSKGGKKGEGKEVLDKNAILRNLLKCWDVRVFGCAFAGQTNVSIQGTTQPSPALNIWTENSIYTLDLNSQFANKEGDKSTTLGQQSKLVEGHYIHHFSINPHNIARQADLVDGMSLQIQDVEILKESLRRGVTYYDSAAKVGSENEFLLWVQLKEDSRIVLPSLAEYIDIDSNRVFDLQRVKSLLSNQNISDNIEFIEFYYHKESGKVINLPEGTNEYNL